MKQTAILPCEPMAPAAVDQLAHARTNAGRRLAPGYGLLLAAAFSGACWYGLWAAITTLTY